jgi:hypothetical protein
MAESKLVLTLLRTDDTIHAHQAETIIVTRYGHYLVEGQNLGKLISPVRDITNAVEGFRRFNPNKRIPKKIEVYFDD